MFAVNKNGIDIYFKKRKTNFYHNNYIQSINNDNLKINFEKFNLWDNIRKINVYLQIIFFSFFFSKIKKCDSKFREKIERICKKSKIIISFNLKRLFWE